MKDFTYFSKAWYKNKLIYAIKKHLIIPISRHQKVNFPKFTIKHKPFKTKALTSIQILNFKVFSNSKRNSGNFSIFSVPGELYEEVGKKLLDKAPFGLKNTFIFQNTNDWIGYLFFMDDYIKQGGWEAFAGFSPLCGYYIEKGMMKLIKEVGNLETEKH